MLIAAFLLGLGFFQGDPALDKPITFQAAAESASLAVRDLSKEAGVALSAKGAIADEVLILRFKDVPLRIAMDKIAEAATGKWVKTEEGYELKRPVELVRAIEKKEHEERVANLKKLIEPLLKDAPAFNEPLALLLHEQMEKPKLDGDNPEEWKARYQVAYHASRQQPQSRFAVQLLASIGLDTVADLPEGRTVYSTSPSQMQRQLPSGTMDLARTYASQQNLWHKISAPPPDDIDRIFVNGNDMWPYPSDSEVTGKPAQCMVILMPYGDRQMIRVGFYLADEKGHVIGTGNEYLGGEPFLGFATSGGVTPSTDDPTTDESVTPDLPLGPLAQKLSDLRDTDAKGIREPSSDIAPFFFHPEEKDPLTLFPSDQLLRAAEMKALNVAACIDDSLFNVSGCQTADEELKQEFKGFESTNKDGWLVIKPTRPLRCEHANRTSMGQTLREFVRDGRMSLENRAAWALAAPGASREGFTDSGRSLIEYLGSILDENSFSFAFVRDDANYLKLYGLLSPAQRASLIGGGSLTVGNMSVDQRAMVAAIVYGLDPESMPRAEWDEEAGSWSVSFSPDGLSIYNDEPTYFLAKGLDPKISLQLKLTTELLIYVTSQNGDSDPSEDEQGLDQFASELLDAQKPKEKHDGDDEEESPAKILGYRVGIQREYALTLRLPGNHQASGTLSDSEKFPGPLLTLDQLPADIQQQIAKKMEELKKQQQDDDGGGDPPPTKR